MKIKRVGITQHQTGWKGTWYKTGEKHFVVEHRAGHLAQGYHAVRVCGAINESDCIELTDFISRLMCLAERVRILIGRKPIYAVKCRGYGWSGR